MTTFIKTIGNDFLEIFQEFAETLRDSLKAISQKKLALLLLVPTCAVASLLSVFSNVFQGAPLTLETILIPLGIIWAVIVPIAVSAYFWIVPDLKRSYKISGGIIVGTMFTLFFAPAAVSFSHDFILGVLTIMVLYIFFVIYPKSEKHEETSLYMSIGIMVNIFLCIGTPKEIYWIAIAAFYLVFCLSEEETKQPA